MTGGDAGADRRRAERDLRFDRQHVGVDGIVRGAAGLQALVFPGRLCRAGEGRAELAYGATSVQVEGALDTLDLVRQAADELPIYLLNGQSLPPRRAEDNHD